MSALGADPHTFSGLAGLGDLVATCSSPLSRNRSVGEHLGRGMSVEAALAATTTTAEGVMSSKSILELAHKHDIEVPIIEVVVSVLYEQMQPGDGVAQADGSNSEGRAARAIRRSERAIRRSGTRSRVGVVEPAARTRSPVTASCGWRFCSAAAAPSTPSPA